MQKIFKMRLSIIVLIFMLILLTVGNGLIRNEAISKFNLTAKVKINQIEQMLEQNLKEIENLSDATYEDYLSRAEAVAYIVGNNPEIVDNNIELSNVATLMQIDEIHIFDAEGEIFAGTVPDYIGLSVNDGVQVGFFKQILEDPTKKLVQPLSQRTADGNLMQYIGVARKDEPGIIQIGILPERMLETLSRHELDYVLSMTVSDDGEDIFVVDKETGTVLGTTSTSFEDTNVPLNFYDMGLNKELIINLSEDEYFTEESEKGFTILNSTEDTIICIYQHRAILLESTQEYVLILFAFLLLISILMILVINKLLKKHVISGITEIIKVLKTITSGNLNTVVTVNNNPEFEELSGQINKMVGYLVNSTAKMSKIIESVDVNIGIYEYRNDMDTVLVTDRLCTILGITKEDAENLYSNKELFKEKLKNICLHECETEEDEIVYQLNIDGSEHYIKINSFTDETTTLGMAVDVTDTFLSRSLIMYERDYDVLSELYNRRAFIRETELVFRKKESLKIACLLMMDMDNLKQINDSHGHRCGDSYIKAGANLLSKFVDKSNCIVSRLSGDEFAVMWYGYDNEDQILEKIHELELAIEKAYITTADGTRYPIRFSAGYIFYPEYSEDRRALLHLADVAMYEAKQIGKGKFVRYCEELGR